MRPDALRKSAVAIDLARRRAQVEWRLLLGMIVAGATLTAVWVGLPRYAEAASAAELDRRVADSADDSVPFGYLLSYNRLSGGTRTWDDLAVVDTEVFDDRRRFHIPTVATARLTTSTPVQLVLDDRSEADARLRGLSFVSVDNFATSARITDGTMPAPAESGDVVPVAVNRELAEELDLGVGAEATAVAGSGETAWRVEIRIDGIWTASSEQNPAARFVTDENLLRRLVVAEETFARALAPAGSPTIESAQWLVLLDGSSTTTKDVGPALAAGEEIAVDVDSLLKGTRLVATPNGPLRSFLGRAADIDRGLAAYSLPILALLVVVMALLGSMVMAGRSTELTTLRRRGQRPIRLAGPLVIEAVVVGGVAVALGAVGSAVVVSALARTETFLRLGSPVELIPGFDGRAWSAVAQAAAVLIVVHTMAGLLAVRQAGSDRAGNGSADRHWFQRTRLDVVAVVVIAATAAQALRATDQSNELVDDPFVILIPALTAVAAGLLTLRIFPPIMAVVASVADRTDRAPSTAALIAARRCGRDRRSSTGPLMLLVVTGSLAVYTASLARTLDLQLLDEAHHAVGAEYRAFDPGRVDSPNDPNGPTYAKAGDYRRVWGIEDATPLAEVRASLSLPGGTERAVELVGIDPAGFNRSAFWRSDYATVPLSELMGSLAANREGVLLPRPLARSIDVAVGDRLDISIRLPSSEAVTTTVTVVGTFDAFPTWYPATEAPLAVVDLDLVDAAVGASAPRRVLFSVDDTGLDPVQTAADLRAINAVLDDRVAVAEVVDRRQRRPDRQGVFGVLTISFVISTVLTLLGFGLYGLVRFRRDLGQFGALRSLGMTARRLVEVVAFDLLFVAALGLTVAVATGLTMSAWFLPRLIDHPAERAPDLLISADAGAALGIAVGLGVLLVIVGALAVRQLRRQALFEAVKL